MPEAIFIEPEPRDTAPAVLIAALFLQESDPDGLMLIAPADHAIPDADAFRAAIEAASPAAQAGLSSHLASRRIALKPVMAILN